MHSYRLHHAVAVLVTLLSLGGAVAALHSISEGSNSDPTSKMFEDLNAAFERHWRVRTGVGVTVKPAKTANGVPLGVSVDGLKVVALAVSYDTEALQHQVYIASLAKPPAARYPLYVYYRFSGA